MTTPRTLTIIDRATGDITGTLDVTGISDDECAWMSRRVDPDKWMVVDSADTPTDR